MMSGFQMMMYADKLVEMVPLITGMLLIPTCYGQTQDNNVSSDGQIDTPPYLYFSDGLIIALSVIAAIIFIILFIIIFKVMYKVETAPPPVQQRHGISESRNLRLENMSGV
ncbi:uncharacterized protein LOC121432034 [Lytechinus variegatus]|uniref:uncharacterized protein LOC121432034 n=1 Tax=Lytechinus variegatus TaxID=7654 RepID=UPI001BB14815|nr:uncharacterized protein LOC121432034 [Lytechinus variegatus]